MRLRSSKRVRSVSPAPRATGAHRDELEIPAKRRRVHSGMANPEQSSLAPLSSLSTAKMRLRSSKHGRSVSPEPPATRVHRDELEIPAKRRRVAAVKSNESKHRHSGMAKAPLAPIAALTTAKMRLRSSKHVRSVSPGSGAHRDEPEVPTTGRRRVAAVKSRGSKNRETNQVPSPPHSSTSSSDQPRGISSPPAPLSPPKSLPSNGPSPLPSPQRQPAQASPPPLPPRTTKSPKEPIPKIRPVTTRKRYPDLSWIPGFTCTFIRALQSSEVCSVILVSLPDGTERILKVSAPGVKGREDPFINEYYAYTALVHHKVSRPPGSSPEPRVVPYCYGLVRLNDLDKQMRRASYWKSPIKNHLQNTHLDCLLLEYIPNAVTVAADPARLSQRPHLATAILDALRAIHAAGIYHRDPMPRNMLLDENDGVWWIDFGWSRNTALSVIHNGWFMFELCRVEYLLLDDVIPAVRNGTIPDWEYFGQ
jgi:hypothetical protein